MRTASPEFCSSLPFPVIPIVPPGSWKEERAEGEQGNTSGVRESLGLWCYSEDAVALGDHKQPCGCLSTTLCCTHIRAATLAGM